MRTKILLSTVALVLLASAHGQKATIELTFTALNNVDYAQLDSIKVMNRTQGGDTVLFYPDTVLSIYSVGIPDIPENQDGFRVFQNYPNPVTDQTAVSMYIPEKDNVSILVTDILGRMIIQAEKVLDRGKHTFRFVPGDGNLYFLTACWQGQQSSIKIIRSGPHSDRTPALEYTGGEEYIPQLKSMTDNQGFSFSPGDELLYIGYRGALQSGKLDNPEESTVYNFQFGTNIPCPGTPTVEYEGQVYNTIQIFSQCWLKENLNVGTMIQGNQWQYNNGIIEKYCYDNDPENCSIYGGIYQFGEVMQYNYQNGAQGICPSGWHMPTHEEWKLLQGAVDSQYRFGHKVWELYTNYYGYDAGTNLKTTTGWYENSNGNGNGTDLYGFSALPAPACDDWGNFGGPGDYAYWWTSTNSTDAYAVYRRLFSYCEGIWTDYYSSLYGFSVRCLKDD